jgi:GTP-binding protein HflX
VVDIAHLQHEDHIRTVNETLKEMGATDKPTLFVFNKIDLYRKRYFDDFVDEEAAEEIEASLKENLRHMFEHDNVLVSAVTGENMEELKQKLKAMVKEQYTVRYPYKTQYW